VDEGADLEPDEAGASLITTSCVKLPDTAKPQGKKKQPAACNFNDSSVDGILSRSKKGSNHNISS
jgi:hypothetical protein